MPSIRSTQPADAASSARVPQSGSDAFQKCDRSRLVLVRGPVSRSAVPHRVADVRPSAAIHQQFEEFDVAVQRRLVQGNAVAMERKKRVHIGARVQGDAHRRDVSVDHRKRKPGLSFGDRRGREEVPQVIGAAERRGDRRGERKVERRDHLEFAVGERYVDGPRVGVAPAARNAWTKAT